MLEKGLLSNLEELAKISKYIEKEFIDKMSPSLSEELSSLLSDMSDVIGNYLDRKRKEIQDDIQAYRLGKALKALKIFVEHAGILEEFQSKLTNSRIKNVVVHWP